jgi:hypothetical protein
MALEPTISPLRHMTDDTDLVVQVMAMEIFQGRKEERRSELQDKHQRTNLNHRKEESHRPEG